MAYCTVEQVQNEFKELTLTTDSVVKTADVEEYIAEADAEINSIIGLKFVVPVTTGEALTLCRRMSRAIASERIAQRLEIKAGDPKLEQNTARLSKKDALALAQKIADGKVAFAGATLVSSADGMTSYVSTNGTPRTFTRDEDQW